MGLERLVPERVSCHWLRAGARMVPTTPIHNPFHAEEHTTLDASDLFTSREAATATWSLVDGVGEFHVQMPVATGPFDERCSFAISPAVRPTRFTRALRGAGGEPLRQEHADFAAALPKLPEATYDCVKLGSVITRMVRPFLPRDHVWYETGGAGPHRLGERTSIKRRSARAATPRARCRARASPSATSLPRR